MKKEQNEKLMLMKHPFAIIIGRRCTRPYTLYVHVHTVSINSAQPDFNIEIHIVFARSWLGIAAHFWCQVIEDELNFVTMKIIF